MKKIYSKPEISANAYAEFENVMTFACSKQATVAGANCHAHPNLHPNDYDPCDTTIKLSGQSDFPCAHVTANFS